jgi:hypothetical protein
VLKPPRARQITDDLVGVNVEFPLSVDVSDPIADLDVRALTDIDALHANGRDPSERNRSSPTKWKISVETTGVRTDDAPITEAWWVGA